MDYKLYTEEQDRKYFLDYYNLKMTILNEKYRTFIILENIFGDTFKINKCYDYQKMLDNIGNFLNFISKNNILKKKNIIELRYELGYSKEITFESHFNTKISFTLDNRRKTLNLSEMQDLDGFIFNHVFSNVLPMTKSHCFYDSSEASDNNLIELLNKFSDIDFYVKNANIINNLTPTYIMMINEAKNEVSISKKPDLVCDAYDLIRRHKIGNISECKIICDLLCKEMEKNIIEKEENIKIQNNKKNFKKVISNLKEHVLEKETLKNKAKYNLVLKEIVKNNIDDKTFIRILGNYSYLLNLVDLGTDKDEVQKIFVEDYGNNDLEKFMIVAYDYKDFRIINN